MANYGTGTYDLLGIPGFPVTALVDPNSTVVFNLVGALDNFVIKSNTGSTVTINNLVNAADTLNLETNGGTIAIGSLAGALGNVTATIDGGGQFIVGGAVLGVLNDANIGFGTGGGSLVLGTEGSLVNIADVDPITGFNAATDVIDDHSLEFTGTTIYTVTGAGTVQTVTIDQGGHSLQFETSGANLATGTFNTLDHGPLQISADGFGGTDITVCFLEGTSVSTPDGEKAIESFKRGDLVITADGRAAPVRWVGVVTVCTAFADALRTMPVRIRAGALDENVPHRDLLVSPQHAMFLDGALVQANALVNGTSIVRETRMPRVFRYYHIELDDHALILAEGAATETFIDNVDRMNFDNWAEHVTLFGYEDDLMEMQHPRAKSPRQVPPALRQKLAARAHALLTGQSLAA